MSEPATFEAWPESRALQIFPRILAHFLPLSNPLYNRIIAPQNAGRHCLYSASFPVSAASEFAEIVDDAVRTHKTVPSFTILFADRSRHAESQVWVFNPLVAQKSPLTREQSEGLRADVRAMLFHIKAMEILEAPGWPFSPICRFGCLHEVLTAAVLDVAKEYNETPRSSSWNGYIISLASPTISSPPALPAGFELGLVPEDQLDIVMSTSTIPRQKATLLQLPNCALTDLSTGKIVAWAYIGIDASFATLYVREEYRNRGFSTAVAMGLLSRLRDGVFSKVVCKAEGENAEVRGFDGGSGYVHSDVHEHNDASMGVMRRLGGTSTWKTSYTWVDLDKII